MPRHVLVIVPAGRLINNSWEKEEPPQSTIILVVWNFWLQKFEFFLKEKESTFFLESLHFLNVNITYIAINIFSEMSPAYNYMYVRFDLIVQTRSKEYPLTDSVLIDH